MTALICDSDFKANNKLANILFDLRRIESVQFSDQVECITFLKYHHANMFFVTVSDPNIDFLRIIEEVRERSGLVPICLIGTKPADSINVFRYNCDRFLQKPYVSEDVGQCLTYFDSLGSRKTNVTIRTFGRFDVFVNGTPVIFHNAKAKELLALCVDRLGDIICSEAIEKLWPSRTLDDRTKRLYRKAVNSIHETLERYNIPEIFKSYRGGCAINKSAFNCDYYSFIEDPRGNLLTLNGEYMSNYDWGESTIAILMRTAEMADPDFDLSIFYE